jgi:hypothetical protein
LRTRSLVLQVVLATLASGCLGEPVSSDWPGAEQASPDQVGADGKDGDPSGRVQPIDDEPDGLDGLDGLGDALAHRAAVGRWRLADVPVRATITGGPWTLGQGPATQMNPAADYPNPNPGRFFMQPYFWPQVLPAGRDLLGYFDYRPRKMQEAVVAARSADGGRSWTFLQLALNFNPNPVADPIGGNENGQGHPFVMKVGGRTLIYTLDRTPGVLDVGGLIVHPLRPTPAAPLRDAPAQEMPLSVASLRTRGLLNPDGILGPVPDDDCGPGRRILYLQRILGSAGPVSDVTRIRLARSEDGIEWTDLGPVSGLQDDGTVFLGARGSLLRVRDGRFLLFFSGGTPEDSASDAYRYIGYAESYDAVSWTVVRGLANPLLSTQTTPASGTPQSWWAGRVFGPTVAVAPGGQRATLVFAGFHTANASQDFADHRQIGRVTLELEE